MKLRCPRCQQKLSVADKFAGRAIRCPSCNRAFNVPKPKDAVSGPGATPELDLEGLATLEKRSTEMDSEEQAQAESAIQSAAQSAADGKEKVRTCPTCHKAVPVDDPYAEMLCSHCWNPIPALIKGSGDERARRIADARRAPGSSTFYSSLISAVSYPISAAGSLATAAGVAVLAALLPVVAMTGGSKLMEQSAVGTLEGVKQADLSGVQIMLMAVFAVEIVFFSAVALHAFLDVVRTTSVGTEKAPSLAWSPTQWGKSFLAYVILAAYLALATYIVALVTLDGADPYDWIASGNVLEHAAAGGPKLLIGMMIVSFGIPMNLIGISLGSIAQGLHPVNVAKSIANTHAHYVFLVLVLSVSGALFGTAFAGILFDWFLPQVNAMSQGSKEGDLAQVAFSLLAWGVVMGSFFYGTYVLARLHGLFARAFRKKLLFGET